MVALPLPLGREAAVGSRQSTVCPSGAALRIFDVVVAAVVLVLFAPLMILIAAAVLAEGGRPVFFSQVRLGRGGRHFRMYKFRKFHKRGCLAGRPLTVEDDPRLSGVGRVLAWTKLDELPQLWNVLKGDMSIVGPRPELLDFQDCFEGPYRAVLEYKPGILGPSQVLFRNEGSLYRGRADPERFYRDVLFPLKAQIDSAYFAHRNSAPRYSVGRSRRSRRLRLVIPAACGGGPGRAGGALGRRRPYGCLWSVSPNRTVHGPRPRGHREHRGGRRGEVTGAGGDRRHHSRACGAQRMSDARRRAERP